MLLIIRNERMISDVMQKSTSLPSIRICRIPSGQCKVYVKYIEYVPVRSDNDKGRPVSVFRHSVTEESFAGDGKRIAFLSIYYPSPEEERIW